MLWPKCGLLTNCLKRLFVYKLASVSVAAFLLILPAIVSHAHTIFPLPANSGAVKTADPGALRLPLNHAALGATHLTTACRDQSHCAPVL